MVEKSYGPFTHGGVRSLWRQNYLEASGRKAARYYFTRTAERISTDEYRARGHIDNVKPQNKLITMDTDNELREKYR